jgi:hypothetical protein
VEGQGFILSARHVLLAVPVASVHQIQITPPSAEIGSHTSERMNAGKVVKLWALAQGEVPLTRPEAQAPLRFTYRWSRDGELLLCAQALAGDVAGRDSKALFAEDFPNLTSLNAEAQDWVEEPNARDSWLAAALGPYPPKVFAGPFGRIRIISGDVACEWA